ncbi:hypothetical protein GUJ93_ZPchr0010g11303 [Zizania palustris]|uniref:Uncharacterized protein n=1 Tax=Zizania palustris TaxID=103762 RepID=A0A8J5WDL0_ZIZPA|nr:hypothetical protein GUJ93_ZPchr0010g11303 [Zizania palustris]
MELWSREGVAGSLDATIHSSIQPPWPRVLAHISTTQFPSRLSSACVCAWIRAFVVALGGRSSTRLKKTIRLKA